VVSGVACAVPELLTALDAAIVAGDEAKTARLEARLQEFISWCDKFPAPVGVRLGVEARGLATGPMPVPLGADRSKCAEEFRAWFPSWVEDVKREAA
jgi:dihydrodipicolinate synthase/N-acetylneuraminate lyase